jgi:hypothetical protein
MPFGVVWCGVVWCGVVWCGVVWCVGCVDFFFCLFVLFVCCLLFLFYISLLFLFFVDRTLVYTNFTLFVWKSFILFFLSFSFRDVASMAAITSLIFWVYPHNDRKVISSITIIQQRPPYVWDVRRSSHKLEFIKGKFGRHVVRAKVETDCSHYSVNKVMMSEVP